VLVVPPFAEEMNKCRRMVTETALGLAQNGIATVLPDLYGTGDSGGEFDEADWGTWLQDLQTASAWAQGMGHPVTGLLALRLGARLALDALATDRLGSVDTTVLWQPVLDAGRHLNQFLRLRTVASMNGPRQETLKQLRESLAAGQEVEVAGYSLSAALAQSLDAERPSPGTARAGRLRCIEVVREAGDVSAVAKGLVSAARHSGQDAEAVAEVGEPFWTATEIVVNRAVVDRTIAAFVAAPGHGP
jgi:exosortase A-associated hydrolase 2